MPPILNIIHLEKRADRLQSLMEETAMQGIAYKVWPGVTTYKEFTNHRNISLAHKQIVQDAKLKGLPQVIIAEDDIKFSSAGAWKYYLSKMPKNFDLYLGLLYYGKKDENNKLLQGRMSGGLTLYCVAEKFYDFFLSVDESKHLDTELGSFANINDYYICDPMVCEQIGGHSDNWNRVLYYDAYLEGKKLYGQ